MTEQTDLPVSEQNEPTGARFELNNIRSAWIWCFICLLGAIFVILAGFNLPAQSTEQSRTILKAEPTLGWLGGATKQLSIRARGRRTNVKTD